MNRADAEKVFDVVEDHRRDADDLWHGRRGRTHDPVCECGARPDDIVEPHLAYATYREHLVGVLEAVDIGVALEQDKLIADSERDDHEG